MSTTRRVAGQHAQSRVDQLKTRMLVLVAVALLTLLVPFLLGARGWTLVGFEVVAIAGMVLADRIHGPQVERWSRGARGERKVGTVLEELGDEWRVLHDVSLGRGNIDHVLVGPAGAFTIETKSHRGHISLARLDPHMLKQAYAEKKMLEKVSGLKVEAILVFSDAWLVGSVPAHLRGVTVLPARMLPGYLQRRRPTFSEVDVVETGERLRLALEVDASLH